VHVALKSAFEDGFFHADPHPGNIFVMPGNIICLLDFGMMGSLSLRDREGLAKLVYNMMDMNDKAMMKAALELATPEGTVNEAELEMALSNLLQEYASLPIKEWNLGEALSELLQVARIHHLTFRPHLVWLLKAIATIETTAHRLVPDFDIVTSVTPYGKKLLRRRYSPIRQARELSAMLMEVLDFAKDLPGETKAILRLVKEGRVKIQFEHMGLDPLRKTLDRVSNRLSVAMILSALLVASSILVLAKVPPMVSDMSIIGITGYFFAGMLGLWLVISIQRSGRL
jgi:ubiquinone biosynthesis protein